MKVLTAMYRRVDLTFPFSQEREGTFQANAGQVILEVLTPIGNPEPEGHDDEPHLNRTLHLADKPKNSLTRG